MHLGRIWYKHLLDTTTNVILSQIECRLRSAGLFGFFFYLNFTQKLILLDSFTSKGTCLRIFFLYTLISDLSPWNKCLCSDRALSRVLYTSYFELHPYSMCCFVFRGDLLRHMFFFSSSIYNIFYITVYTFF